MENKSYFKNEVNLLFAFTLPPQRINAKGKPGKSFPYASIQKSYFKLNKFLRDNNYPLQHIEISQKYNRDFNVEAIHFECFVVKELNKIWSEDKIEEQLKEVIMEYLNLPVEVLKSFHIDYENTLLSLQAFAEVKEQISFPEEKPLTETMKKLSMR